MQIGPRPAYEDRGFSPGFTSIRPTTSGFFGQSIPTISNWAVIDQDEPDTNFYKPGIVTAGSDTFNQYEGTSGSTKSIFLFDTPLKAANAYFFGISPDGAATSTMSFPMLGHPGDSDPTIVSLTIRITPITSIPVSPAAYAETVTWNIFINTPPGIGAPVTFGSRALPGTHSADLQSLNAGCSFMSVSFNEQTYVGYCLDVTTIISFFPASTPSTGVLADSAFSATIIGNRIFGYGYNVLTGNPI